MEYIIGFAILLLFAIIESIKEKMEKNIENKKNKEVDKRFKINSVFDKVYSNMLNNINTKELEEYRKNALKEQRKNGREVLILVSYLVIIVVIIVVLTFLLFKNFFIMLGLILALTVIPIEIYIKKDNKEKKESSIKKYYDYYYKKIVREFLNQFEEKIDHSPNEKIESYIYNEAEFEKFDNYYSNNLMKIKLKNDFNIDICNVFTEYKTTDNEGDIVYRTLFRGVFTIIETPKPFNEVLYLKKDKKYKNKNIIPKIDKIQLDSAEFENYFDVYSSNKILAMQLLTSDIMEFLKEFQDSTNIDFELTLKNNRIFIRFFTDIIFDLPDLTQNALDKEKFKRYYKILNFTIQFTYKITNLLNNTEY